jgi:DNA-binding transcriptional ArsR family regulator
MAEKKDMVETDDLLDLEVLGDAAECLKTLAHPHRLRMVQMMLRGKYSVGQLAKACSIPSHMASEHLRLMQRCGLLSSHREGRCTYYEVAQPHLAGMMACIESRFGDDALYEG